MPAEWAPHAATWLAWPHKEASWPGKLSLIPPIFAEMARLLAPGELVHINVRDSEMQADARKILDAAGVPRIRCLIHQIPTNDSWIRDHGPMFLNGPDGRQKIVDWGYNAWGGKYPPYDLDDVVPTKVGELLGLEVLHPGIVMEGGSIDVNGQGLLLTTEACLLNPNRNPHLNRDAIAALLREYTGATQVLWLGDGIVGDDTDGHVDDLTRFVAPDAVVTVVEDDPADANYAPLQDNLRRLRAMPFTVHTLPMPAPVEYEGQRLPASYANFYIANEVVLLPAFADKNDEIARETLQRLFPTRRIVPIDCRDLIWGLGAFHCLTQQQPLASK